MLHFALYPLSLVLLILAGLIWRAGPRRRIHVLFAAFTFFIAAWALGIAGLHHGVALEFSGRFTFATAALIPAAFLAFIRAYPSISSWPKPLLHTSLLGLGVFFAGASMAGPYVIHGVVIGPRGLERQPGPLFPAFLLYFLTTWALGLAVFVYKWRTARGLSRAQLQYLGAGIIVSAAGAISANLLLPVVTGHSTHSWVGPYFSLVLIPMVAHAIIRHRLMDLRPILLRVLIYAILMGATSAVVISLAGASIQDTLLATLTVSPTLAITLLVALAMVTSPARYLFANVIEPYLYRRRLDYSSSLQEATHRLSHLMQPAEFVVQLRDTLHEMFIPDAIHLFTRSVDGQTLDPLASHPHTLTSAQLDTLTSGLASRPLRPQVVSSPELRELVGNIFLDIEVAMLLVRRGRLLGIVLLGPRRSGDAYFSDDLSFLESLAALASITLENALLYRQRLETLEYSERLIESLDAAVVAVNPLGHITSFNRAASQLIGLEIESQGAFLDVLPPAIAWSLAFTLRGSWRPRDVEISIEHSAAVIPAMLSTTLLGPDPDHVSGALVIVTDLSTVKALERHQARLEHLSTMARFYAGLAHEIRSPLASISNFVSMLPDRFDDPEYRDSAIRLLPAEVARIVRLADKLRLMAPSAAGTLVSVDLPTLLADIVTMHAPHINEYGIDLRLSCPPALPRILGDASQLVQLFVNLLNNACEAMPHGGTVIIEAQGIGAGTAHTVSVAVIDEGVGLNPDIRSRIFQPFFTTKPSGTGLGLSICKEIADFHHARLTVSPRTQNTGTIAIAEFRSDQPGERDPSIYTAGDNQPFPMISSR